MTIMVAASGGVDSTVMAYDLVSTHGRENVVLGFCDYRGVTSKPSLEFVRYHAQILGVKVHKVLLSLPTQLRKRYYLFNPELAEEELSIRLDQAGFSMAGSREDFARAYVPGLYTMMWTSLGSLATVLGIEALAIGMIEGPPRENVADERVLMDSSPEFIRTLAQLDFSIWGPDGVEIITPYENMTKEDVVATGIELNVDFGYTMSCDLWPPCEVCDECEQRELAF